MWLRLARSFWWHSFQAVLMRAGIVNAIRVNRNAGSPGPSLAGRASLPSIGMWVDEIQVEAIIPTPDPT
jgi:hypothetical protein